MAILLNRPAIHYRWAILAAATIGMATNISPLFFNTLPVFLREIVADTGWSRTQVFAGISVCTGVAILVSPIVGSIADRRGSRRVIMATCVPFGLSVMAMRYVGASYGGRDRIGRPVSWCLPKPAFYDCKSAR